jgi:hypothetical protein
MGRTRLLSVAPTTIHPAAVLNPNLLVAPAAQHAPNALLGHMRTSSRHARACTRYVAAHTISKFHQVTQLHQIMLVITIFVFLGFMALLCRWVGGR